MPREPFLTPQLIGARFEGAAIPLDVLADFAGLNELLIETAKWEFLQANPKRKRSPRGFTDGLELKVTGIEDGSAKPVIELFTAATLAAATALFPVGAKSFLEQARDAVIEAVDAAATGRSIQLPPHLLAHFDRFGRSLEDGESIEFKPPADGRPAIRLDKPTRRALLLAPAEASEITESAAVLGLVPNLKQTDDTFEIELPDGRRITGPLTPSHRGAVLDAAKGYSNGQLVWIEGVCLFDRRNRLIGVASIDAVTLIDPLDVGMQLNKLRALQPGWFNGDGPSFSPVALDRIEELFNANYPADLPLPHLGPTPDGAVRAEWLFKPSDASLEINPETLGAYWHVLNLATGADAEDNLDLTQLGDWRRLATLIRALPGVPT